MGSKNQQAGKQAAPDVKAADAAAPEGQATDANQGAAAPTGTEGSTPPEGVSAEGTTDAGTDAGAPAASTDPVIDASASADAQAPGQVSGGQVASTTADVGTTATQPEVKSAQTQADAVVWTSVYSPDLKGLIDQLEGNAVAKAGFAGLEDYLVAMAPGKQMNSEKGAEHQVAFFRNIQLLLNQTTDDFPRVLGTLLAVFKEFENKTLGGQYLFRFTNEIKMNPNDRRAFERILHLLMVLADSSSRAAQTKTIDFPRSLEFGVTEDAKRRILAYFNK